MGEKSAGWLSPRKLSAADSEGHGVKPEALRFDAVASSAE